VRAIRESISVFLETNGLLLIFLKNKRLLSRKRTAPATGARTGRRPRPGRRLERKLGAAA
jgi:hypothetical protein